MTRKTFKVTEEELVDLMKNCEVVQCDFWPSGVSIVWEEGYKRPDSVTRLGLMRGILNKNMDGCGI